MLKLFTSIDCQNHPWFGAITNLFLLESVLIFIVCSTLLYILHKFMVEKLPLSCPTTSNQIGASEIVHIIFNECVRSSVCSEIVIFFLVISLRFVFTHHVVRDVSRKSYSLSSRSRAMSNLKTLLLLSTSQKRNLSRGSIVRKNLNAKTTNDQKKS